MVAIPLPRGAFAPVPTPLDLRLAFAADALRAHLSWLAGQGLDGALVLGTNGEFPSFTLAERRAIAEAAAPAGSGLRLMLGIGSCALPEVLELARVAGTVGYESVLCPPPFYFRAAPVRGLAAFFRALLDDSPLPVLLYHIPQVSGVPISDELLDLIGEHPRLAGVKDSSEIEAERVRLGARFADRAYFVGTDRYVDANRRAGGAGSISAAASVAPALVAGVGRGSGEQEQLERVRALLESHGLGQAVKAILRRCGLGEYATRPPMNGLEPAREGGLWDAYCELVPPAHRPAAR
jgi:4-hydroxy-tetrahydrodipicolinate synthase